MVPGTDSACLTRWNVPGITTVDFRDAERVTGTPNVSGILAWLVASYRRQSAPSRGNFG